MTFAKSFALVFVAACFPVFAQAGNFEFAGPRASRLIVDHLKRAALAGDLTVTVRARGFSTSFDKDGIQCLVGKGRAEISCALPTSIAGATAQTLEEIFRGGIRDGRAPINEDVDNRMNRIYSIDNVSCKISDVETLVGCQIEGIRK